MSSEMKRFTLTPPFPFVIPAFDGTEEHFCIYSASGKTRREYLKTVFEAMSSMKGSLAGLRDAVKDTDGTPDSPENMEKVLNVMQSGMDGSMLVDTSIRMLATCIYRYDVKTQRPIPGPVGIEVIQEWPEEIINELVAEADKRVAITQTPAKNS